MANLPDGATEALDEARNAPLSYEVDVLRAPDGRLVAVLGEAHLKLARAKAIGQRVIECFELRGVETFQQKKVFGGRALGIVIHWPRLLLRWLSLGAIKGSTITDAKQLPSGYTTELERAKQMPFGLHVASVYLTSFFVVSFLALLVPLIAPIAPPLALVITTLALAFQTHFLLIVPALLLRRHSWCWLIHPFLGILTLRDDLMANGTVTMLADHPRIEAAVVIMGRAHVGGYARLLIEHHGFARVQVPK